MNINYNSIVSVTEDPTLKYIGFGINEVYIDKVEVLDSKTDKYDGKVMEVTFKRVGDDAINTKRYFPFSPIAPSEVTPEKQLEAYLKHFKHVFTKASSDAAFNAAMLTVTSFESMGNALKAIAEKRNGGKNFRLIFINKGGYATVPMWTGGIAESLDVNPTNLTFNAEKYGKKTTPKGAESKTAEKDDDLPF
jgi:hypothetical protein